MTDRTLSVSSITSGDTVTVSVNGRWVGDLRMDDQQRATWDLLLALAGHPQKPRNRRRTEATDG